jgi:hypothetical protein
VSFRTSNAPSYGRPLTGRCSVCLISILRAIWLDQLLYSQDQTWDLVAIANWSVVEINVAILCACLPTMKPVLRRVFGPLAQRFFPHQSPAPGSSDQPRTIGSTPMHAINMRRGQAQHFVSLGESEIGLAEKGTSSVSQADTDQGELRPEHRELETGSKGVFAAGLVEGGADIGTPPPAHVKSGRQASQDS